MAENTEIKTKCDICNKPYIQKEIKVMGLEYKPFVRQCDCEDIEAGKRAFIENIRILKVNSGIPYRFIDENLKDWRSNTENVKMYEKVIEYEKNLENNIKKGTGLMLMGKNGVGKTKLCCWLLLQAIEKYQRGSKFISFRDLCCDLIYYRDYSDELKDYAKTLSRHIFLLIDDIGLYEIAQWRKAHLSSVIDKLWLNQRAVLFTTNMSESELEDCIGMDAVSRIMGICKNNIVICEAKDMRSEI